MEDYRLTFQDPAGCMPSECQTFIGIDTNAGNSDYLDIYMEGNSQGWVAVGFSESANMVMNIIGTLSLLSNLLVQCYHVLCMYNTHSYKLSSSSLAVFSGCDWLQPQP